MNIFDRYVFKNLLISTVFISIVLMVVVFLTQSLKFLELVMESGADSGTFWVLTFLALPRFFEFIVPFGLCAAVLFVYNRMSMDSELVIMRSGGYAPFDLARPALMLAMVITIFLWGMTMWVAPKALSGMNELRQAVKAQVSSLLFRDGVFNQVTDGLTIYIRGRDGSGDLRGVMIHDSRDLDQPSSITLAKRGQVVADEEGYTVIVYDGSRQSFKKGTNVLQRLDFQRYTIDFPSSKTTDVHWNGPEERTVLELLNPDLTVLRDQENVRDFKIELHRRIIGPLLAVVFTLLGCLVLLLGPLSRRGQSGRIVMAVGGVVFFQGGFIMLSNMARESDVALFLMYGLVFVPLIFGFAVLLEVFPRVVRRRVNA